MKKKRMQWRRSTRFSSEKSTTFYDTKFWHPLQRCYFSGFLVSYRKTASKPLQYWADTDFAIKMYDTHF